MALGHHHLSDPGGHRALDGRGDVGSQQTATRGVGRAALGHKLIAVDDPGRSLHVLDDKELQESSLKNCTSVMCPWRAV